MLWKFEKLSKEQEFFFDMKAYPMFWRFEKLSKVLDSFL